MSWLSGIEKRLTAVSGAPNLAEQLNRYVGMGFNEPFGDGERMARVIRELAQLVKELKNDSDRLWDSSMENFVGNYKISPDVKEIIEVEFTVKESGDENKNR